MTSETDLPHAPRRVVVAGVGPTGSDVLARGARRLRDAGIEVIWAGDGLTAEQIAAIAVAEDADAVTTSSDSASVVDALAAIGAGDIAVEVTGSSPSGHELA